MLKRLVVILANVTPTLDTLLTSAALLVSVVQ